MQERVVVTQSQRWLATEQKKSELEHGDGKNLRFPANGMKSLSRAEQSQTELGPAPIVQVGCKAKCRLEQKEGYGQHAIFLCICLCSNPFIPSHMKKRK
jgi:hypothetical protein